jgi:hypothetical protein
MARRKISRVVNPSNSEKVATIYRDPDAGEFVVVLKGRPAADYFTPDRDDAEGTARKMVLEGVARRSRRMAKRSKLGAAARACKGKKKGAFRACVRKHMKKRRR